MPTNTPISLTCLVFAIDPKQGNKLVDTVQRHQRVEQIHLVSNHAALRDLLAATPYDFVLVVAASTQECLPACLLRYPEMQLMVVTPSRKMDCVEHWLQQGANDVVSQQRYDRLRFALKRMIDECSLRTKLRKANRQLASQNHLQQILLNSHHEALMLWQNGKVLKSNACFLNLIACKEVNKLAKTNAWCQWLTDESYELLHHRNNKEPQNYTVLNWEGLHYHVHTELLILDGGPAQLIRINPTPEDQRWLDKHADSVTGLLLRERFITQLDQWLLGDGREDRYTITQITFDHTDVDAIRVDTTLHELLIYRAANQLEQFVDRHTLMARTDSDTLVLAGPAEFKQAKKTASQIKQCIGNVGGLLDDSNQVKISTLTLAVGCLNAKEVLGRLNKQQNQASARNRAIRSSNGGCVDTILAR